MIIDGLKQQYDERLLLLVPKLNSERPEIIENPFTSAKAKRCHPLLNSTLGVLSLQHAQWDKAETYFKAFSTTF